MDKSQDSVHEQPRRESPSKRPLPPKISCVFLPIMEDYNWKQGKAMVRFIPLIPGHLYSQTSTVVFDCRKIKFQPGLDGRMKAMMNVNKS